MFLTRAASFQAHARFVPRTTPVRSGHTRPSIHAHGGFVSGTRHDPAGFVSGTRTTHIPLVGSGRPTSFHAHSDLRRASFQAHRSLVAARTLRFKHTRRNSSCLKLLRPLFVSGTQAVRWRLTSRHTRGSDLVFVSGTRRCVVQSGSSRLDANGADHPAGTGRLDGPTYFEAHTSGRLVRFGPDGQTGAIEPTWQTGESPNACVPIRWPVTTIRPCPVWRRSVEGGKRGVEAVCLRAGFGMPMDLAEE